MKKMFITAILGAAIFSAAAMTPNMASAQDLSVSVQSGSTVNAEVNYCAPPPPPGMHRPGPPPSHRMPPPPPPRHGMHGPGHGHGPVHGGPGYHRPVPPPPPPKHGLGGHHHGPGPRW